MKNLINYIKNNPQSIKLKIIFIFSFFIVLSVTDLLVKQLAYTKLKDNPPVTVIPGFWSFQYETNDDIGFSALRWVDKYLGVPKRIPKVKYEEKVIGKLGSDYRNVLMERYYQIDKEGKYYDLTSDITVNNRSDIKGILSSINYRTSKWLFLVMLQGFGTIVVITFFFYSKLWRYILPLGMISSGALGNVLDRIIRGYVVDYVRWDFKIIPLRLFNPWPIFNLADSYTVVGAISLFIVLFFFPGDEELGEK